MDGPSAPVVGAEAVVAPPEPHRAPSWVTPREALGVWFARSTLRKTLKIAAVVGTILSLINQGSVIIGGDATVATWLRVALNFVVPFCVSSIGFLSATRRRDPRTS